MGKDDSEQLIPTRYSPGALLGQATVDLAEEIAEKVKSGELSPDQGLAQLRALVEAYDQKVSELMDLITLSLLK